MNDIQTELNFLFVTVGWFAVLVTGLYACYWAHKAIDRLLVMLAIRKARRFQAQTQANLQSCEDNMIAAISGQYTGRDTSKSKFKLKKR